MFVTRILCTASLCTVCSVIAA